ncbi:response regulator [Pararobbsia silviterrae]|uniref:Sensory/regulatory protein RpfC n=2 Tax=Pararobbsia silviterrae TaxID=1792498 RepID=A0A494XIU5_9BURK|nr:response regulator [Pararobbsia silviterrae]
MSVGAVALVLSLVVCMFATWAVGSVYDNESAKAAALLDATLDEIANQITIAYAHERQRVEDIATFESGAHLAQALVANQDRPADAQRLSLDYAQWVAPIYRSGGYSGYILATSDGRVLASSWPSGFDDASRSEHAVVFARAAREGTALSPPLRPVSMRGTDATAADVYQLVCARIEAVAASRAVLCLRIETSAMLASMVAAGRFAKTGEVDAVDAGLRLVTPTRFAVPPSHGDRLRFDAAPIPRFWTSAPAQSVEDRDYRGMRVARVARWLNDPQIGIAAKQDLGEALASYRFARDALVALAGVLVAVIVALAATLYRAERRLAQSHARLRAIFAHAPATIHIKDRRHALVLANPALCALVGNSEAQMLGKVEFEWPVVPDAANERWVIEERVMKTGRAEPHVYSLQSDRGLRYIQVVRFPVRDPEDDDVVGVGAVGVDITEQVELTQRLEELSQTLDYKVEERTRELKVANAALEAATRAAQAAAQAKASFLAHMSHEIRTPMNAVIGMAHLALKTRLDVRQRGYLDRIQSGGRHLLDIVDEILDLSRIEAGKLEISRTEFSLDALLQTVSDFVAERAAEKGLELIVDVLPQTPDWLVGDALRVRQVLVNLVSNAVKFTDSGDVVIRVRSTRRPTSAAGVRLLFEVLDSGIGIRADDRARVFESFEQADVTTASRYGGSGLGLALCRRLVTLMGGSIGVRSAVGEGSVFHVELDFEPAGEPRTSRARIAEQGIRLLVVDDHAYARGLTANMLRDLGFEVDEAHGGDAALACVRAADADGLPYRLVFVDALMPDLDGLELARRIEAMRLHDVRPHCVLMAVLGKEPAANDLERASVDAIVYKPVHRSALLDVVDDTLRRVPVAATDAGARTELARSAAFGAHARVLVVDDDPICLELAMHLLQDVGIAADTAETGLRALELLETQTYDLILTDIVMPIIDGVEFMRRVRADRRLRDQIIVATTANALHEDLAHYIEAGMDDCIVKPLDPDRFHAALRRWLRARPASIDVPASDAESLFERLSHCAQLDVRAGLTHVAGKPAVYRGMLERFVSEYADRVERIESCLARDEREAAALHAHSLKGVAGIIGANALSSGAGSLESLLRAESNGEGRTQTALLASIRCDMAALIAALETWMHARGATGSRLDAACVE